MSLPEIGVVFLFFILAILNRYVVILTKVLICISLMANEHLFMCLFAYILFGEVSV